MLYPFVKSLQFGPQDSYEIQEKDNKIFIVASREITSQQRDEIKAAVAARKAAVEASDPAAEKASLITQLEGALAKIPE